MKKKKLTNGDILKITLPMNLGFAYARFVDVLKIYPNATFPDLLFVYNCFDQINPSIEQICNSTLLFPPIFVAGLKPTINKGLWVNEYHDLINIDILQLPNFRYIDDERKECYLIRECSLSNKVKIDCNDNEFLNLNEFSAYGTGLIELKIAFKYLINKGKSIEDYFEIKEYMDKSIYNWAVGKIVYK